MKALEEESKEVKEVTPTVSSKEADWGRKAEEVIKEIGVERLREIYDA